MSVFTKQVGGSYYKMMGMQPIEFAMRNRLDPCAFSILKYLSRHRSKNGRQDVAKADHFAELREALIAETRPMVLVVPMRDYIEANGITGSDAEVLMALEGWIEGRLPETTLRRLMADVDREYDRPALPCA